MLPETWIGKKNYLKVILPFECCTVASQWLTAGCDYTCKYIINTAMWFYLCLFFTSLSHQR